MTSAQRYNAPDIRIDFRNDPLSTGMPDATAILQSDGLYFCVYGGLGWTYLGEVVVN